MDSIRALVVEDDPAEFHSISERLTKARPLKFEVVGANRLASGLQRLQTEKFDVVLIDLDLPDSSGVATLKQVRAACPKVPIIIMLDLEEEFLGLEAIQLGAQDYLVKGVDSGNRQVRAIEFAIERKQMEDALLESEKKANELFASMTEMVAIHELVFNEAGQPVNYRLIECNRAYTEITGITKENAVGKLTTELYQIADAPYLAEYSRVAIFGEPYKFETFFAPMEKFFAISVVSPGRNKFATISTDITRQKLVEKELRETRDYFNNLLNYANAPIVVWDADYRITRFNHAFEELIGSDASEVLGQNIAILFPSSNRQESFNYIRATTGERWEAVEIAVAHKDGSVRYLLWNSATLYTDDDRTAIATIAQGHDITERKMLDATQTFLLNYGLRPDEDFFRMLAEFLSRQLGMFYVCIDRLSGDELMAETVAIYCDGQFEDNVKYALKDTPCGALVDQLYCIFPRNVSALFPHDLVLQELGAESYAGTTLRSFDDRAIGLIAVIGRQPLENRRFIEAVLKLVSIRAAAEMERRLAEKELREKEAWYRAMMEQSWDAVMLVDFEAKMILETNRRWRQILGYSQEELQEPGLYDLLTGHLQSNIQRYEKLQRQGYLDPEIIHIRTRSGMVAELEQIGSMLQLSGKKVAMFCSRDLSEERQLQQRIHKDTLLAGTVQKSLLPGEFNDGWMEVNTIYQPYNLVSGDFFDYGWSADYMRFSGFVLDVSGHGVASSLLGIVISTYFRDALNSSMDLVARLNWINRQVLPYFMDGSYAAAIYFEFDFLNNTLTCAIAGIHTLLIASKHLDGKVMTPGSLVGISDEPEFGKWTTRFEMGDAFYFLTDGIYERITGNETISWKGFPKSMEFLHSLATDSNRTDDCSGVCVRIKDPRKFPLVMQYCRYGGNHRIQVVVNQLFKELAGSAAGKLNISFGEALTNAARESMEVRVRLNLFGNRIMIRVKDQGRGFNGKERVSAIRQDVEGLMFEKILMAEGGRGIMIMVAWMDKVIYNRKGNEVMMVKRLLSVNRT